MVKYTDITQNTYVQNCTVTETTIIIIIIIIIYLKDEIIIMLYSKLNLQIWRKIQLFS
jgi:hypothetical protein